MRVLILSSDNGGGHNAVARALKEVFEAHGDTCQVEDCLSFISKDVSRAIAKSHVFVYRHAPRLFASGYRHTQRHPKTFMEHHSGRQMLNLGCRSLGRTLRTGGYGAAICTHVFASLMLTDACRKYGLSMPTGVVETDYTASPGAHAGNLDWHFIPAESLREDLVRLGVDSSRIIATGIPVRGAFYNRGERGAARRALGLPERCHHLLMMGGSMGAGPVAELARAIIRDMGDDCAVSVVCGTNQALWNELTGLYGDHPRVRIHGYMECVAPLMESADLLLTKPGGITVTEAAVERLPMVLVNAVAGCEAHNLNFFTRIGGAVTARTPPAIAALCLDLLRDDARRDAMSRALEPIARANDREVIWRIMRGRAGQD